MDDIVTSPAGTLGSTITPKNPRHVDTFKIGTSTYAGVGGTNGLFIVDITDTESPEFVSRINGTGDHLNGVPFTTFVEIGDSTYALSVASDFVPGNNGYHGRVMITDVSIPDSPVVVKSISDGLKVAIQNCSTQPLLPLPPWFINVCRGNIRIITESARLTSQHQDLY